MSKYDRLRRSQIIVALLRIEHELLATDGRGRPRVKNGSQRDSALRKERKLLKAALDERDEEILKQWRASLPASERRNLRY